MYRKKKIFCGNRETVILLQNQNGPCPFIAILNILLLRASQTTNFITKEEDLISGDLIIQYLIDKIIKSYENDQNPTTRMHLGNSIEHFYKLQKGLTVNLKFSG